MKTFVDFSIEREKFLIQFGLASTKDKGLVIIPVSKNDRLGSSLLFRKPKVIGVGSDFRFPALLVSNGGLSFVNSGLFGVRNGRKSGTLLFEDFYSERGR